MQLLLKSFLILLALIALLLFAAGRLGYLRGHAPTDLGVHASRLKPPSNTPNSVSSQAQLYPDHPRRESAQIAPFAYSGDGHAAMQRLASIVETQPRTRIVFRNDEYLRAEMETRWLRFTDDVEFWLDDANHVIQVRSASRIGRRDFDANRARIEALRAQFGSTGA